MNILFVRLSDGYSGAEIYNLYLLAGLKKYSSFSLSLLSNQKKLVENVKNMRVTASFLPLPIREVGTKKTLAIGLLFFPHILLSFFARLKQLETKQKFDCIVLESTTEKLFLTAILRSLGYKIIWIEHAPMFGTTRAGTVKRLYRWASHSVHHIIAVSSDTKLDLIKGDIAPEKITAIHIGIDVPTRKKPAKTPVTIGFFGGVNKEKGIDEFLNVAHTLSQTYPDLRFLVIGGGIGLLRAKEKVKELHIEKRVMFTGFVDTPEVYVNQCDIMFFPTRHIEGLSLAMLESMALGTCFVARDIGGNRELVINGKTGLLFTKDAEAVALLQRLLKSHSFNQYGTAGRAFVQKHFSQKIQTQLFVTLFQNL